MNNYGFTIIFNTNEYFINFNTDTITTINDFISPYTFSFNLIGMYISSGSTLSGYTLVIDGMYPNVNINNLSVKVNTYSSYSIIDQIVNNGTLLSANELYSSTSDFYSYELSSGMIISLYGSNYPINNKEYNILGLTQNTIELSYQGPFLEDLGVQLNVSTREYLRKPRESYTNNIQYHFYWETEVQDT